MSLSVRCFAHAQISFLVANTTKKNYKANCAEIAKVQCLKTSCQCFVPFSAHLTNIYKCTSSHTRTRIVNVYFTAGGYVWARSRQALVSLSLELCGPDVRWAELRQGRATAADAVPGGQCPRLQTQLCLDPLLRV